MSSSTVARRTWDQRRLDQRTDLMAPEEFRRRGLTVAQTAVLASAQDAGAYDNDWSQATEALRPTLLHDGYRPVVRFGGTQWMQGPLAISSAAAGEVVVIITGNFSQTTFGNGSAVMLLASSKPDVVDRHISFGLYRVALNQVYAQIAWRNGGGSVDRVYGSRLIVPTSAADLYILRFRTTGSAWVIETAKNSPVLTLDTLTVPSGTNHGGWFGGVAQRTACFLGTRTGTASSPQYFTGDMVGALVTNRSMPTAIAYECTRAMMMDAVRIASLRFTNIGSYHTVYDDGSPYDLPVSVESSGATPASVEIRVDGGSWLPAASQGGSVYGLTLEGLTGESTIQARYSDLTDITATVVAVGQRGVTVRFGASNEVGRMIERYVPTFALGATGSRFSLNHQWGPMLEPSNDAPNVSGLSSSCSRWAEMRATFEGRGHSCPNFAVGGMSFAATTGGAANAPADAEPGQDAYDGLLAGIRASGVANIDLIDLLSGGADMAWELITLELMRQAEQDFDENIHVATGRQFGAADVVEDTFQGANGTVAGHVPEVGGGVWTVPSGGVLISGNKLVSDVTTPSNPRHVATLSSLTRSSYTVEMTTRLGAGDTESPRLWLRYNPADGTGYYARIVSSDGWFLQLREWDGATDSNKSGQIAVPTPTAGVDYIIRAEVTGARFALTLLDADGEALSATTNQRERDRNRRTGTHIGAGFATGLLGSVSALVVHGVSDFPIYLNISGPFDGATREGIDATCLGQMAAWNTGNILPGAHLRDIDVLTYPPGEFDGAHYKTIEQAEEWMRRLHHAVEGGARGPRFLSAAMVDVTHLTVTVTVDVSLPDPTPDTQGWRFTDAGADRAVLACTLASRVGAVATFALTLEAPGAIGADSMEWLISYASGNDAAVWTPDDHAGVRCEMTGAFTGEFGDFDLPLEMFVDEAVG